MSTLCYNLLPAAHNPSITINTTPTNDRSAEVNHLTENIRYRAKTETIPAETVVSDKENG